MSSIQQEINALREEKESLDFRIAELERSMRWQQEEDVRRAEVQHEEDLYNIARLRTDVFLVTSNPAMVRLLDNLTTGGATPHSQGRAWAFCEDSLITMLNVNNGISMPALRGKSWPDGAFSMSGVFSHSRRESDGPSGINYPKGAMIDFDLLYRGGLGMRVQRKGLMLKGGAILQLVPEKKVYTSLGTWIVDLAQPAFGVVRVRLPDPRTRHEKAQEEVSKLASFEQKIDWLLAHYKLKQFPQFGHSPKMQHEHAVNRYEREKEFVKKSFGELNLGAPGAAARIQTFGRWLKNAADYKERTLKYMNSLSEEARDKRNISIWNRWKSFLFIKDAEYGRCVVAAAKGCVYHQVSRSTRAVLVLQGPTQVFLSWRGQEIAFNV